MATPSSCLRSPPAPPRSSRPNPSPLPNPPHSRRYTPRARRRSPLGRPCSATPLSPLLLTCESWSRCPHSISAVVFPCEVVLNPVSAWPRGRPKGSLFRPPSNFLLPPSSRRPLRPLALPLTPLPPTLAADIARRDEDAGNWTGGVGALRLVAGGSAPRRKSPSRPRIVVADGISRPLFLHLT